MMSKLTIFLFFSLFIGLNTLSQAATPKTETFKVYGNCDRCKSNIEGSLKKKDGILSKDWNQETKMLTVTYDSEKISLLQIKQKIADVGYDTDAVKAKAETYNKLAKCCQYERPKAQ